LKTATASKGLRGKKITEESKREKRKRGIVPESFQGKDSLTRLYC